MPIENYAAGMATAQRNALMGGEYIADRRRDAEQARNRNALVGIEQQQVDLQRQRYADEQARIAAAQTQVEDDDREWDEAYAAKDWHHMARIDPQATRMLWDHEQAQQPAAPEFRVVGNSLLEMPTQAGVSPRVAYTAPERAGGTVRLPDGTVITTGGVPGYGPVELGKPARGDLERAFVNAQGNSLSLQQQLAKWRPEFSTYGGQMKAGMGNVADKLGHGGDPELQQYLNDYNSWKSDTAAALSQYLNQLSGAAISPAEEARLKSSFPNDDDGPTQYYSKLRATVSRLALVQARSAYLLSNPSVTLDSLSLDKMQQIMVTEANALARRYESSGKSEAEARALALQTTRAKYGIGNAQ